MKPYRYQTQPDAKPSDSRSVRSSVTGRKTGLIRNLGAGAGLTAHARSDDGADGLGGGGVRGDEPGGA